MDKPTSSDDMCPGRLINSGVHENEEQGLRGVSVHISDCDFSNPPRTLVVGFDPMEKGLFICTSLALAFLALASCC